MANVFQLEMGEFVLKVLIVQYISTATWELAQTSKSLALYVTIAMNVVVQQHVFSTIQ